MIEIIINGQTKQLEGPETLEHLLKQLGYQQDMLAVALNHSVVPKSLHRSTLVGAHDHIEVVSPMAGG